MLGTETNLLIETILARARKDASHFGRSGWMWIVRGMGSIASTFFVALVLPADTPAPTKFFASAFAFLFGALTMYAPVFVISLFMAPYRQRDEARAKLRTYLTDEVSQAITRLKAYTVSILGSPVDGATILYKMKGDFAHGASPPFAPLEIGGSLIAELSLRGIIQQEQRTSGYGTLTIYETCWLFTDFGRKVIQRLEQEGFRD